MSLRPALWTRKSGVTAALAALAVILSGCVSAFPALRVGAAAPGAAAPAAPLNEPAHVNPQDIGRPAASAEDIAALVPADRIDVELPPQPLPQMLNTVFGDILKVPYALGPDVGVRTEVVTLRGGPGMTKRDFFRMVQVALQDYGLKVYIRAGTVNVVNSGAEDAIPIFLRGRPSPETPQSAQPVTQFYEAHTVAVDALIALLSDVFPQARNITFSPDPTTNSVVVSGGARDVANALALMSQLDQPGFAGVGVVRVEPVYWSADTLAKSLNDTLAAEGYGVSGSPQAPRSILVLAFPTLNQVLMFAKDPALLARARFWADKLDQPAALGDRATTFIYQVQNTDARTLVDLVSDQTGSGVSSRSPTTGAPGSPPAAVAAANGVAAASSFGSSSEGTFQGGRVIVDPTGNKILFTGTADTFSELRKLLVALDAPTREVLVEVTIAEVTLTDETNLGLEWFFNHSMSGGRTISGGTMPGPAGTGGNLSLGSTGLTLNYSGMTLQAAFNAFASNNKVNILSRPRLVARSGSEASIQVGTDVPIITSQANAPVQSNGTTSLLQTIEYRQTGIILHIKPLVYGDNRVDLVIGQEVSSEQPNPNTAIASPLILDRNITTQLSLTDGATAVLGGLIDNSYTKGDSGIPVLKDVPVLGEAFRTDTISGSKTELVVLVTPYVLHETDDMTRWANRYSSEMNAAFKVGQGFSYTLTAYAPNLGLGTK